MGRAVQALLSNSCANPILDQWGDGASVAQLPCHAWSPIDRLPLFDCHLHTHPASLQPCMHRNELASRLHSQSTPPSLLTPPSPSIHQTHRPRKEIRDTSTMRALYSATTLLLAAALAAAAPAVTLVASPKPTMALAEPSVKFVEPPETVQLNVRDVPITVAYANLEEGEEVGGRWPISGWVDGLVRELVWWDWWVDGSGYVGGWADGWGRELVSGGLVFHANPYIHHPFRPEQMDVHVDLIGDGGYTWFGGGIQTVEGPEGTVTVPIEVRALVVIWVVVLAEVWEACSFLCTPAFSHRQHTPPHLTPTHHLQHHRSASPPTTAAPSPCTPS